MNLLEPSNFMFVCIILNTEVLHYLGLIHVVLLNLVEMIKYLIKIYIRPNKNRSDPLKYTPASFVTVSQHLRVGPWKRKAVCICGYRIYISKIDRKTYIIYYQIF